MLRVFWTFLPLLLVHCIASEVFLQSRDASQVLNRQRRANSGWEEFRQGNMERECVEERCDFEEAREIFEHDERTDEFWNIYFDGDACESHPCMHNGVCKDGIGTYTCFCPAAFQGKDCEIAIPELCENKNGGCDHFCKVEQNNVVCSCATGYQLWSDGKSCRSNDPFKCGVLPSTHTRSIFIYQGVNTTDQMTNNTENANTTASASIVSPSPTESDQQGTGGEIPSVEDRITFSSAGNTRIVNGDDCRPGECPWQALLMNEDKIGFCGGTILNEYFILSAAHCMNQSRYISVVLGDFDTRVKEHHEATYKVDQVLVHRNYVADTYHNDIALIKLKEPIKFSEYIIPACLPEREFAENVLMRQATGMVSGFGRVREGGPQSTILQKLTVPYVDRATCIESSSFKISNRMFCAGYDVEKKDACQGDSGGPHVTRFKDTWFVTGVVSWGEGCARSGKYGVYTQVSKYIKWIESVMAQFLPPNDTRKPSAATREKRDEKLAVIRV
ncbi:coagulation factor X [Chanos chanos]|uniref:coagulation factor Xa n=1 Tax=Chanos chanos TaxID=29144 RepID=A0A6J2VUK0_CHACN|nr:coagulation factor X-like [Chanos chanos]